MNLKPTEKRLAVAMTVIFVLMSFLTVAQVNIRDIVYLKNGSIIKGDILEVIPNETIKIKTSDGSIFVFRMDEVERTGKDEPPKNPAPVSAVTETDKPNEKLRPMPSGYLFMLRLGPNVQLFNSSSDFSAGVINAVQVNQYLSLGIGAEATTYVYDEHFNSSVVIFPIFFDARFYIPGNSVQPMFSMQLGYSVVGNKKDRSDGSGAYDFEPDNGDGGLFFGVNAGIRLQATKRMALIADGGISKQKLNGRNSYSTSSSFEELTSIRGNIGLSWNLGSGKK